jgi:hypothetical protein
MVVFPVKVLPWLMLIGGLGAFFVGEGNFGCALSAIIGGIWAFFQVKNKAESCNGKK